MYRSQWHAFLSRVQFAATSLILMLSIGLALSVGTRTAQAQQPAVSPTEISSDILTDTTLTLDKSPYRVIRYVRIQTGATLTIQPGVVVQMADQTGIDVYGGLVAEGVPGAPILFTGVTQARGAWLGIDAGSTTDAPARLSFRHVTVEYAGMLDYYRGSNLTINGSAIVNVENSTFRQGGSNGINLENLQNSSIVIRDSAFLDNQHAALRMTGETNQLPVLRNLRAEGNGIDALRYQSVTLQAGSHLLTNSGLPYRLEGGYTVEAGSHLVVEPGVEMHVESIFRVQGELTAMGSAEGPIRFTRIDQGPNWWGLQVASGYDGQAKAQLAHVIIEYAGLANGVSSVSDGSVVVNSAVVSITNSLIDRGGNHGVVIQGSFGEKAHAVYIADTQISNHPGGAVRCNGGSCRQTVNNLVVTSNGFDGIIQAGAVSEDEVWANDGIPYLLDNFAGVSAGATLTVAPGVEIRFLKDAGLGVGGNLVAVGTPEQPIRFTGTTEQPGWWRSISIQGTWASARLQYCDIGYGGASYDSQPAGMLDFRSALIFVSDCRLHHSAGPAIASYTVRTIPTVWHSRFEENAYGILNANGSPTGVTLVDARNNWWGVPSGPAHSANPSGTGAAVSDGVLFDPWLTDPDSAADSTLEVRVATVDRYAPGQTVLLSIFYANNSAETLKDAVLRVALPAGSDYVDGSGGVIFWPERRQAFWKLGDLAPGSQGILAVRVRYEWGLPIGLRSTVLAQLSGSNINPQPFDLAAYLAFQPRFVAHEEELAQSQVDADRASIADLDALYTQAVGEGFVFGSALQRSYSSGELLKQAILLKFEPSTQQMSAFFLWWQAGTPTGVRVDSTSFTVYKPGGALRYDLQTQQWQDVTAGETAVDMAASGYSWNDCMANCVEEKLPSYIVKKYIKILSTISKAVNCVAAAQGDADSILNCSKMLGKAIPGYGEAIDLGTCNSDCQGCVQGGQGCSDGRCHCCKDSKYRCSDDDWLYGTFGMDVVKIRRCGENHRYLAEEVSKVCALCEKCIDGDGGPNCVNQANLPTANLSQLQPATAQMTLLNTPSSLQCQECVTAADPNDMQGPEGDLLPGQLVTYTINYENVGGGQAYGVFVVNELSEYLDLASLELPAEAIVSAATRTIFFEVGELAAKGQPGSSGSITYRVRVKAGLPSGTVVTNQADVHFPSVPEVTPTNVVANMIVPIAAQAQSLETAAGQPLAFHLEGRDVSNTPLSFAIVEMPLYGELRGTPPALTYTPAGGYAGRDRVLFTVSNGNSTSSVAEVAIRVQPAPGDKTAPSVLWTAPKAGQQIGAPASHLTPLLQIQFSEAMNPNTVIPSAIQLTGPEGQPVALDVHYDPVIDQAMVRPRAALANGAAYNVTVKRSVSDLAGNTMTGDVTWMFQIGNGGSEQTAILYLPVLHNSAQ